MIGGGAYLSLIGFVMYKIKEVSSRRKIGIYNIVVGLISIVGGIIAYNSEKVSGGIFSVFIGILIISFIMFSLLNKFSKKG